MGIVPHGSIHPWELVASWRCHRRWGSRSQPRKGLQCHVVFSLGSKLLPSASSCPWLAETRAMHLSEWDRAALEHRFIATWASKYRNIRLARILLNSISNTSSDKCIDSATTSKSSPINIVELFSNLIVNHSDVGPFLAYSSTFQYESCPSQIPQQIHALTPPRRAREILSTSLSCFQISLSTILISDRSLPIQLHFNRSIYRNTHLQRFISVFKYGYKTEPAMKLLQ